MEEPIQQECEGVAKDGSFEEDLGKTIVEAEFEGDYMDPLEIKLFVEESNHVRTLLPEDVWLQVIDQLTDGYTDLEQLSSASLYFRKLICPKRVLFLFPQVLKLVVQHLVNMDNETVLSTVLRCRLVCSSWNQTVDNFIQEVHSNPKKDLLFSNLVNNFRPVRIVRSFLQQFDATHPAKCERNPFIIKNVDIYINHVDLRNQPDLLNLVTNLLEKYGHHISNFKLSMYADYSYSHLRDWLLSLVNLKSLIIGWYHQCLEQADIRRLEAEIRVHPLPNLQALRSLKTYNLPASILNELLRRCDQLYTLHHRYNGCSCDDGVATSVPPLLTVKQLQVFFKTGRRCFQLDWAREKSSASLRLTISAGFKKKLSEILQRVQDNCGHVVEHLSLLEIPKARSREQIICYLEDSCQFKLELSHLRHFELFTWHPVHLDFLLGSKDSIETLKIVVKATSRLIDIIGIQGLVEEANVQSQSVTQFIGYENRMLESNIWNLFPKLENLSVDMKAKGCVFEYNRAQWGGS